MVKRYEVYLVPLDPTVGSEIKKNRPCVVISPNEMHGLNTAIIAPMTTKSKAYPTRIAVTFAEKTGFIVIDQIRRIDKARLIKFLGTIDEKTGFETLRVLREMFDP